MQNVEIILDHDFCSDDWEYVAIDFNEYLNFRPNLLWDCGTGCSIQNVFKDGEAQKIKEDLHRKYRIKKWRIIRVEITPVADDEVSCDPMPN